MSASLRQPWTRAALAVGVLYAAVGIVFAMPATHARAWRLAAWGVSAAAFAAHIAYERLRRRASPRLAAVHCAAAAALGAFGLAVAANVHAVVIGSTGQHQVLLLLSLVIWPVMTALPAFVVALAIGAVLARSA